MLKEFPCRHDLLFLTEAGRRQAWQNRDLPQNQDEALWQRFSTIPAICRGRKDALNLIDVGFSFPIRERGARLRIATRTLLCEIERRVSPFEAAIYAEGLKGPVGALARSLGQTATTCELRFGIFGAAALEAVTGLPYLDENSDLDAVIDCDSPKALPAFWNELLFLESKTGIRVDIELRISKERYLKLRELFSDQSTILIKGVGQPSLISRDAVWEELQNAAQDSQIKS